MSKLKMPEPYGHDVYVEEADNGYFVYSLDDPELVDDATNHGATTTTVYTDEALRDVLEQAARLCDAQDGTHDHIYSAAVRALIKEVK